MMQYGSGITVPSWHGAVYSGSNVVLNTLTIYWSSKTIETKRNCFLEAKKPRKIVLLLRRREGTLHELVKQEDMVDGLVDCVTVVEGLLAGNGQGIIDNKAEIEVNRPNRKKAVLKVEKMEIRRIKSLCEPFEAPATVLPSNLSHSRSALT